MRPAEMLARRARDSQEWPRGVSAPQGQQSRGDADMQAQTTTTDTKQTSTSPLKFKPRRKCPSHRLPFVDAVPGHLGLSFWAVPKTGGYDGGHRTGMALASIYMKYLKENDLSGDGGGALLGRIVLDMFDFESHVGSLSAEQDALMGQVLGFFLELSPWLISAAKRLDGGLDQQDDKGLLKIANAGLGFPEFAEFNNFRAYIAARGG